MGKGRFVEIRARFLRKIFPIREIFSEFLLSCLRTFAKMYSVGRAKGHPSPERGFEMTKYMLTGKTIKGNFQDKPFTSCSKHDLPTGERITITIDGIEYERTLFERIKYRTQGENTHIAFFVIVNGIQYEVAEIEPAFELADFEVVTKEDILNMDCNYNIEGETAYYLDGLYDDTIISFAGGVWCAEYEHFYYPRLADGSYADRREMDYMEDFIAATPEEACAQAAIYAAEARAKSDEGIRTKEA